MTPAKTRSICKCSKRSAIRTLLMLRMWRLTFNCWSKAAILSPPKVKRSLRQRRSSRALCATMLPRSTCGRATWPSYKSITHSLELMLMTKLSKYLNAQFRVSENTWRQPLSGFSISTLKPSSSTWDSAFCSATSPFRHHFSTLMPSPKSKTKFAPW